MKSKRYLKGLERKSDRKPVWPADEPIPRFKSMKEEVRFWHEYDFEDGSEEEWEELVYEPQATRHSRRHVYRVRLRRRDGQASSSC